MWTNAPKNAAPDWSGCGLKSKCKPTIPQGTSRSRRAAQSRSAKKCAILLCVLMWLCPKNIFAQNFYKENDGKKHYLSAISGMLAAQFVVGAWDRFVLRAEWAQVGWNDVKNFYRHGTEWDGDWYWTNFVLHPYQGGLAYLAGRNSNLNRVESLVLTAASDVLWEWFFETNAPSRNDLVYSFLGGFATGEMLYRLSLEADQIHWLLGWAVNPERLWTEFWTRQRPRGSAGNIYEFTVRTMVGTTHTRAWSDGGAGNRTERFPVYFSPEVNIVYNNPYGHDSNVPYSQFELRLGGAIGKGSGFCRGIKEAEKYLMYDVFIFSSGMLFSRAPDWGENKDTSLGMVFDYDFRWHSYMDISSLAPGFAIKQRISYENSRIEWQFHADVNVLGTTDYYHFHRDSDLAQAFRDYSYMVGGESVFLWRWISDSGWMAECNLRGYLARDLPSQTQGPQSAGWELFGFVDLNLEMPLSKRCALGLRTKSMQKKPGMRRRAM